ncbi:MAG: hypothetical protein AAFY65_16060 [Pseudomonadota bacterium]
MQKAPLSLIPFAVMANAASAEEANWSVIKGIDIKEVVTEDSYKAVKIFPSAIENGVEQFDITGFAMPFSEGGLTTSLMLVSDMVTCPFCNLPDHAAALEVTLAEPIAIEDGQRITLRGALNVIHDPETWQAAVLRDAHIVES